MTQLEHNDMLHPEVLLHPLHALCPINVIKGVVVLAIQPVHDIAFEVFQKIHFALQLVGVLIDGVRLPDIYCSLPPRRDVVEMPNRKTSISLVPIGKAKKNVLLVGTQHETSAIVKMHTNTSIRQRIAHAVLVAIVDP